MENNLIKEKLLNIIKYHLGKCAEDTDSFDDLGADSLDLIELVMACEEEFGIEIPDNQAEAIKTVRDAYIYLKNKVGESYGA